MRILIIEDHRPLAQSLARGLREETYAVDTAFDGEEGYFLAESNPYDAIILDLIIPKLDGLELLKKLRQKGISTPVLILTALDAPEQIVAGLETGADDYLIKPFHFEELLARIRALIRRETHHKDPLLKVSDLLINTRTRQVERSGQEIVLTAKEYALLEYLALHQGEVVSRTELWEHAYDWAAELNSNVLDVHLHHLRQKIDQPFATKLLHTVKGAGLVLKSPGDAAGIEKAVEARTESQNGPAPEDSSVQPTDKSAAAAGKSSPSVPESPPAGSWSPASSHTGAHSSSRSGSRTSPHTRTHRHHGQDPR